MSSTDMTRLYSKSIDELYEELGRTLVAPEFPKGASVSRQVAVQRGRSFLSSSMDKLKAKICVDWHYCSRRGDYSNFQSLAYAVAPLVSSVAGVPTTTAMIVVILLIRIGLDDLCHCPNT